MMVKPGIYKHYKGDLYKVYGVGLHSETHEELVVYQGLYDHPEFGKNPWWVRPVGQFIAEVEINGKKVKRFAFIRDA